eukprot:3941322-Rhodomonas_salina.6
MLDIDKVTPAASICLRACYAMSGTEIAYGRRSTRGAPRARLRLVGSAIRLRASYAMSGTDLAAAATHLRPCYVMSSTNLAYCAICLRGVRD